MQYHSSLQELTPHMHTHAHKHTNTHTHTHTPHLTFLIKRKY